MNSEKLVAAYTVYAEKYKVWDAEFDLATFMDRPAPPEQSVEAAAGEIIFRRGTLAKALAEAVTSALNYECDDWKRAIYQELIIAAVDD